MIPNGIFDTTQDLEGKTNSNIDDDMIYKQFWLYPIFPFLTSLHCNASSGTLPIRIRLCVYSLQYLNMIYIKIMY